MSHPEFTVTIEIQGAIPAVKELQLIRKLDRDITEMPVSELKRKLQESGFHRITGLIKPYLSEVLAELDENGIVYTVS